MGWIHLNAKRNDSARASFEQALKLDPELKGAQEGLRVLDGVRQ
jgi:hypothetical protein